MARLTKQQIQLFDELHNSRLDDFKTFNKKSYRGIWNSVIEKYPESAHFVYELLQNADDAEATEVYIIVNRHEMIFKHNGTKHFDITKEDAIPVGDINSITGIGDSSKTESENKIGKFGVGFKAVFQYTETPEIYDEFFKFKIENFIIPTLLTHDHPERQSGETLFLFPFKDEEKCYNDIVRRLDRLQNPILFLRNLSKIVWRVDTEDGIKGKEKAYSKTLLEKLEYDDDTWLELFKLNDGTGHKSVFLFSENILVSDENKELPISVGYYYDEQEKKLITDTTQKIFCFFPTSQTFNTCFISHAPFLLTDNRQQLKPDNEYNQSLIEFIAELAAKAVLHLRDYGKKHRHLLIDENITSIIPQYKKNYWASLDEQFEAPIIEAFQELVDNEEVFLSRNGKYLKKSNSYIGTPKELVSLLTKKQFKSLVKPYDVDLDDFDVDFLKFELAQSIRNREDRLFDGIKEFNSTKLGYRITPDFMNEQEFNWVIRLYNFLRLHAINLWKIAESNKTADLNRLVFRKAPIIQTNKGEWLAPFIDFVIPQVYFPIKKEETSGYNFVSDEFIENEAAKKFFDELHLKTPDTLDYIKSVILTKFRGQHFKVNNEDLISDFEVIVSYFFGLKETGEKEALINLLKEKIYLVGSNDLLNQPVQLFFKTSLLNQYFFGDQAVFFNSDFYKSTFINRDSDIIHKFLAQLGVKEYPSIISVEKNSPYGVDWFSDLIPLYQSCSEFTIKDYELDGFQAAVSESRIDKKLSLYLWNEVIPKIDIEEYERIKVEYRLYRGRTYRIITHESSFKHQLISLKWIFNKEGDISSPDLMYLEDLAPEYNRNNGLISFLNIGHRPEEKSIKELGGTDAQQRQQQLGAFAEHLGLTREDMLNLAMSKKNKADKQNSPSNTIDNDLRRQNVSEGLIDTFESSHGNGSSRLEDLFDDVEPDVSEPKLKANNEEDINPTSSNDRNAIDDLKKKLDDDARKQLNQEEIKQEVKKLDKYSKEWFQKKLELEYRCSSDSETNSGIKRSVSIKFNKVWIDKDNNRLYELRNPSRDIPLWIEEVENLTVKFLFNDRDELPCQFEVANVRDFSLRLKAKASDAESLAKIDWTKLTLATIDINNPTNLIDNFRRAFENLNLPDGFNLKNNLKDNITFVFGPPGTGKTTFLANYIIEHINSPKANERILVLAPTNKACDVLVKKIMEITDSYTWLGRFVTTGEPEIEDNGVVCDRNSDLFMQDKCCIVTTMARLPYDSFQVEGGHQNIRDISWDLIICDEASMLPIAQITYAIYKFRDVPFLIAGDPMQIAPIDVNNNWESENIYDMVRLNSFENPTTEPIQFKIRNLDTQYRSIPAIGDLFSDFAYGGRLKHSRQWSDQRKLNIPELPLSSITYIPFRVESYDSMFGAKSLSRSPIHIYSALLATELSKFITCKYAERNPDEEDLQIGIICPYASQAQLIEKLLEQVESMPTNVKINTGTIHSFQGDQCDIVITVFNPPRGLRQGATNTHLNNLNIINVAISRAKDYLIVLMPDKKSCEGYDNLVQIKRLGAISTNRYHSLTTVISANKIEEMVFGKAHYLESNTFVTSHQLANVYTRPTCLYEIRVDENSVDIQIGS